MGFFMVIFSWGQNRKVPIQNKQENILSKTNSSISGNDFAARFMKGYASDDNIHCITLSPHMLEEMIKVTKEANNEQRKINEILGHLKSIRIIEARNSSSKYHENAEDLLNKNKLRYQQIVSDTTDEKNSQVWIRKKGENIMELVLLKLSRDNTFQLVNITGNMNDEVINELMKIN